MRKQLKPCMLTVFAFAYVALAPPARGEGTVYAMTNALTVNQVKVFHRADDGTLSLIQTINSGGGGSGTQLDPTDSLGSQGALVLDKAHKFLFAVNTETTSTNSGFDNATPAGDCNIGSISSFRVGSDGTLTLIEKIASGGLFPNSLAVGVGVLYVLSAGGPGVSPVCSEGPNIKGFKLSKAGYLTPLAGSKQSIDPGSNPGVPFNCDGSGPFATANFQCGLNPPAFPRSPGQISFTPDGLSLIVTVKGPNSIYAFPVGRNGKAGTPTVTRGQAGPNHPTFFGFAFDDNGNIIVSEPFGKTPVIPAAPFSSVSSFAIKKSGAMQPITSSLANGRGTSCWVVIYNQFAYIGNNNTSDVSSYKIAADGSLTLVAASAATGLGNPNDLAIAVDSKTGNSFLYVLESGTGNVGVFRISSTGALTFVQTVSGLPASAGSQGLAAY